MSGIKGGERIKGGGEVGAGEMVAGGGARWTKEVDCVRVGDELEGCGRCRVCGVVKWVKEVGGVCAGW